MLDSVSVTLTSAKDGRISPLFRIHRLLPPPECPIPAFGFARAWCESCGHGFAVAFSCKTRGLCPTCNARRMAQTAAHVIDHVMPRVPVRQVVLSVPKRIRWFLHQDPKVVSGVLSVLLRALKTTVRKHSPGAPTDGQIGAVSFIHRAGSSLNVHPASCAAPLGAHFHNVICDGIFAANNDGEAVFYPATELSLEVFAALQETLRRRILGYMVRHGYLDSQEAKDMLMWEHGGGFSLHGNVRISECDRDGQEKLLRYCGRPPFTLERLANWDEERLVYQFQRPLPNGQSYRVFSPIALMKQLAELIHQGTRFARWCCSSLGETLCSLPPPWMNLVRYTKKSGAAFAVMECWPRMPNCERKS